GIFPTLFFLHDPPTTEIYPLSLHDALPISFESECIGCCAYHFRSSDHVLADVSSAVLPEYAIRLVDFVDYLYVVGVQCDFCHLDCCVPALLSRDHGQPTADV